jgi:hypothetical protein
MKGARFVVATLKDKKEVLLSLLYHNLSGVVAHPRGAGSSITRLPPKLCAAMSSKTAVSAAGQGTSRACRNTWNTEGKKDDSHTRGKITEPA